MNRSGSLIARGVIQHANVDKLEPFDHRLRFTRISLLNYANVQLENPDRSFPMSKDEIKIDPATFKGADTNIQMPERALHRPRTLNLNLNGALDLRL